MPCRRPGPPPAKLEAVRPPLAGPWPVAAAANLSHPLSLYNFTNLKLSFLFFFRVSSTVPAPIPAKLASVRPPLAGPKPAIAAADLPFLSLSLISLLSVSFSLTVSVAMDHAGGTAGHHGRPDLHRTHARRRWRSPTKAQARRGGEHTAGPEPRIGPASILSPSRSPSSSSLLSISSLSHAWTGDLPETGTLGKKSARGDDEKGVPTYGGKEGSTPSFIGIAESPIQGTL